MLKIKKKSVNKSKKVLDKTLTEIIRKRELHLKGSARAKLMRTKEFDHSKWIGGKELDYRFFNARRIINDIYNWR